jgi:hypothetical protein
VFRAFGNPPLSPEWQAFLGFIATAAMSYVVGRLSFQWFEMPCVQAGKKGIERLNDIRENRKVAKISAPC